MIKFYYVGKFVRLKDNIFIFRFEWFRKGVVWVIGKIIYIYLNGCFLVKFFGRLFFGNK